MFSLALAEPAVKGFMNRLLREDLFDAFEVRSVEITASTRMDVSGALEPDHTAYIKWAQLRPLICLIIKNGPKPSHIKIIFSCDEALAASIHPNASALFLNLTYEKGGVSFTAATAQKLFALDKTLEARWDEYVTDFFARNGIPGNAAP